MKKDKHSSNIECLDPLFPVLPLALPVIFKQKLRNVLIEEGNSAVLRCELSKPGHTVEWMRGGHELIKNGEKYQMRQRDMLIELKILDVKPEDSDIYTCICGNIETTATLTVNGKVFIFDLKYIHILNKYLFYLLYFIFETSS